MNVKSSNFLAQVSLNMISTVLAFQYLKVVRFVKKCQVQLCPRDICRTGGILCTRCCTRPAPYTSVPWIHLLVVKSLKLTYTVEGILDRVPTAVFGSRILLRRAAQKTWLNS